MGALASILESLASKAAEYMVDSTPEQLGYLFNHESKFQNLWSKVQELKDARQRVQQSVDEANRNGEKIFDDVERWLTMVNDKISDQATTQLQEDEKKAMESYFAGFLLGIKSRYHLSKKAEKEMEAITQLLNGKDQFDRVSYRSVVEGMSIRPVKEYEAFGSRSDAFNGLMAVLNDDNVNIIGVYGMGGVGKTTLVKEAARQIIAKEKKLFDEVILVAITQASNNSNIQNEITEKLGLKIEERSVDVRAARLHDRLKKINKVLIILDDIWEEHDLDALGIPSVDKHKGLKISMTSRRLEVLKSMGSQKSLPIDILKEDEAWNLFKIVAGPIAERSDLQSKANEVAQKCAGLPITIATVAKALKHKENLHEWEDALEQLKPSEINCRGVPGAVYSAIEMSYKYLKTEDLKSTFLLCSIMGHNAAIEDLLKYCTGLGLFHGLDTIQKVRNRVLTLVSELEDSSLLLAGSTPECFGVHDVVCDVAISIASGDRGWLALGKEDVFEGWSDVETMRNYNLVSLQHTKVIFPVLKKLGICCGIEYEVQDVDLDIRTTMECELEACRDDDSVKELVKKCLSSSGGMENVERLWPNQLDEHSYSKLTSFFLEGCRKLLNVFPLSMLMRLQKLENLSIWNCESLEEIICESQSQEINVSAMQSLSPQLIQSNVITFEFPCLPSLTLIGLPNLKSICHKTQAISWHLLKKMEVYGCNKVEILFASQEISGNINEQPLFWVNKFTFPNLHQLTLGWNVGVKEIWRLIPSSISFQNLIILEQIDMVEKFKNSEEYLSHLSTSNSQNDLIKEYENSEKDQSNPCKKQKRHGT